MLIYTVERKSALKHKNYELLIIFKKTYIGLNYKEELKWVSIIVGVMLDPPMQSV